MRARNGHCHTIFLKKSVYYGVKRTLRTVGDHRVVKINFMALSGCGDHGLATKDALSIAEKIRFEPFDTGLSIQI